MYAFAADPALSKPELYRELLSAADALTAGEPDPVANMANVAALIGLLVPGLNWSGFYRRVGEELVLGPFAGKPACIRIPLGQGGVRYRGRAPGNPACRRRPRVPRPYRLRPGQPFRAGRAGAA
jgi:putative methionine-R-sulfoxide reductase with GAF domain